MPLCSKLLKVTYYIDIFFFFFFGGGGGGGNDNRINHVQKKNMCPKRHPDTLLAKTMCSCIIYYFFLQKISKEIKKLAERELSLEDMEEDDSIFMQEERYKARFVKVWEKLCEVKGREPQTGRLIEQKFRFQGTLLFC